MCHGEVTTTHDHGCDDTSCVNKWCDEVCDVAKRQSKHPASNADDDAIHHKSSGTHRLLFSVRATYYRLFPYIYFNYKQGSYSQHEMYALEPSTHTPVAVNG